MRVGGELLADAAGRTKKEAEQEAARRALERLAADEGCNAGRRAKR